MAKVNVTVGSTTLQAEFKDNATSKWLIERMPFTVPMMDLYGREMCHRYGANALPTSRLRHDGYEVGDIAYWPPAGSLVILYAQNGERFGRQQVGHIASGVEVFQRTGDCDVAFALADGDDRR